MPPREGDLSAKPRRWNGGVRPGSHGGRRVPALETARANTRRQRRPDQEGAGPGGHCGSGTETEAMGLGDSSSKAHSSSEYDKPPSEAPSGETMHRTSQVPAGKLVGAS